MQSSLPVEYLWSTIYREWCDKTEAVLIVNDGGESSMARFLEANANRKVTSAKITVQYSSGVQKGISHSYSTIEVVLWVRLGPAWSVGIPNII